MEGMFTFVGIIIIVFGVLQIILFFKIWGMTNDVKRIKQKTEEKSILNPSYEFCMLSGENATAYMLIRDILVKELLDMSSKYSEENFIKTGNNLISKYYSQLKETKHPIPDFLLSAEKFIEHKKYLSSLIK